MNNLLPSACVLCGDRAQPPIDLCAPCKASLPWLSTAADGVMALCHYVPPFDRLITALKFKERLLYARLLSELLLEQVRDQWYIQAPLPELLIPMPLHADRLRERGFNQAVELARPLAKQLKIPLDLRSCQRIRATQAQLTLSATERQRNMDKAFTVKPDLSARHVAIIDDVVTTGHTMAALSSELRKAGVEQIDVWCCARTPLPARKA